MHTTSTCSYPCYSNKCIYLKGVIIIIIIQLKRYFKNRLKKSKNLLRLLNKCELVNQVNVGVCYLQFQMRKISQRFSNMRVTLSITSVIV